MASRTMFAMCGHSKAPTNDFDSGKYSWIRNARWERKDTIHLNISKIQQAPYGSHDIDTAQRNCCENAVNVCFSFLWGSRSDHVGGVNFWCGLPFHRNVRGTFPDGGALTMEVSATDSLAYATFACLVCITWHLNSKIVQYRPLSHPEILFAARLVMSFLSLQPI